jgi:glycine hydroxymethyltransferase
VADGTYDFGILACTSGVGMSIAANRHRHVRAASVRSRRRSGHHPPAQRFQRPLPRAANTPMPPPPSPWRCLPDHHRLRRRPPRGAHLQGLRQPHRADRSGDLRAITAEEKRQRNNIELIASENFASPAVMEAQGSVLTNKYAEGYPGRRWYGGCENVDVVEQLAIDRAKELFGAEHANVQPHSGSQANTAVYFSVLKPGDKIFTMDLAHGGHLTHGHKANFSGRFYDVTHYGVSPDDERIDYDEFAETARELKPALITVGASAYPRIIDFERMGKSPARSAPTCSWTWPTSPASSPPACTRAPVPHADFVTSTTHKSLRGPRGGIILCKEEFAKKIDAQVFPGIQGGPLMHVIAAKAVCFGEALKPEFKEYSAAGRQKRPSHRRAPHPSRLPHRLRRHRQPPHARRSPPKGLNGKDASHALDEAGITVNKNGIPFDTGSPMKPSGIRIGTPAVTTRGMKEKDVEQVADFIHEAPW